MGGIDTGGGGHGGKKSVDQEIPLIPFIDLLFCCVMFLLASAVWNQLARLSANQQVPGQASADSPPPEETLKLILRIQGSGYSIASSGGGEPTVIARNGEEYNVDELRTKLQERKRLEPNRRDIIVAPEDGVKYEEVVRAMDVAVGEGFPELSLSDGAGLM